MKSSIYFSVLGVLGLAALVTFSNSPAQDTEVVERKTQQKLMRLDGAIAQRMKGDPGSANLPQLLKEGWRVVSITPVDRGDAPGFAYALLEK